VIFSHVITLVAISLMPLWFGMGWIYGLFAVAGGAPFLLASWRLLHDPARGVAMRTFHASLAQFALLSVGVVLDEASRWAF
jgi:protoheme IX farnesyltransferase